MTAALIDDAKAEKQKQKNNVFMCAAAEKSLKIRFGRVDINVKLVILILPQITDCFQPYRANRS